MRGGCVRGDQRSRWGFFKSPAASPRDISQEKNDVFAWRFDFEAGKHKKCQIKKTNFDFFIN